MCVSKQESKSCYGTLISVIPQSGKSDTEREISSTNEEKKQTMDTWSLFGSHCLKSFMPAAVLSSILTLNVPCGAFFSTKLWITFSLSENNMFVFFKSTKIRWNLLPHKTNFGNNLKPTLLTSM